LSARAWDRLTALANGDDPDALPDYSGSCMIALYPPPDVADQLAVDGGLAAGDMHLTIAYAGDAAGVDSGALLSAAQGLASRAPAEATISGHARFTGGDDGDVIVALIDSPAVDQLRRDAEAYLAALGITLPPEHGFTPHMTICYPDPGDPDPVGRIAATPVTFGAVTATHGEDRTTYPFGEPAAQAPSGWAALSQGVSR
jgi:2'-5' RNA ligase